LSGNHIGQMYSTNGSSRTVMPDHLTTLVRLKTSQGSWE
jgi:hypothetical protein